MSASFDQTFLILPESGGAIYPLLVRQSYTCFEKFLKIGVYWGICNCFIYFFHVRRETIFKFSFFK